MPKRSREASFSPSADPTSSSSNSGDEATPPLKISALSVDQKHEQPDMQCSLPPHRDLVEFPSIDAFELHYAKEHSNRCSSCGKNFPTTLFLALHLDEHHNPLREELEAKGEKTYGCFVEGCEKLCSNPQKRRLHLIDKHAFPRVYHYRVVSTGIDRSTSMLRESTNRRRVSTTGVPADSVTKHRRRSSQQMPNGGPVSTQGTMSSNPKSSSVSSANDKPTVLEEPEDHPDPISELEQSMSALRFIPPSVTRRQGKKKGK